MTDRLPILLDCDPGHDDALAIVVAGRCARLLGITTVAGNAPIAAVTRNALIMRELLALDVEVHQGAERPLVAAPTFAPEVHGASGFDGPALPAPRRPIDSADAVGFIIDTCAAHPGTWIVATGPLTNIAAALQTGELADHVAGISVMGGGRFGNRTAVAEANIATDPEAAAIVFASGVPLKMAGLDVTHQFQATPDRVDAIDAIGSPLATVLADALRFFSGTYRGRTDPGALAGAPMHDVLAVLALTHPQLFRTSRHHVAVETAGELTRGMTVIDERHLIDRPEPNCTVLDAVDAAGAFEVLRAAIAHR